MQFKGEVLNGINDYLVAGWNGLYENAHIYIAACPVRYVDRSRTCTECEYR